jgi:hypothetical protein
MRSRTPPTLSLFFEGASLAPPIKLGAWELEDYHSGLDTTKSIFHDKSFGTLRVVMQCQDNPYLRLLVDGKYVPLTAFGDSWVASVPLLFDVEFHRIAVLARPRLALTLDIAIEHVYSVRGSNAASPTVMFSKWSTETYEAELLRLGPLFNRRKQTGVRNETLSRGLTTAQEPNLSEALLQTCGRLSIRLETAQLSEMRADFHVQAPGETDREGLLSAIKEDFRRLVRSEKGPITINGERYSSIVNVRHVSSGSAVDLSPVLVVLNTIEHLLRGSSCPVPIIGMLAEVAADLERNCRTSRSTGTDISHFFERPMSSAFGLDVQALCSRLFLLATKQLGRDSRDHGIFWLKRAVRDFDVFETAVFASCASAFGFTEHDILNCETGVLQGPGIIVGDANTQSGREIFATSIRGWRDASAQPAGYRPDTFVILNGSRPVLIDAKFRTATSTEMLAHPDGLKDVQAYLDDFSLTGAIVVVPRILKTELCLSPGLGIIQSTDSMGKHRMVVIVELQRSSDHLTSTNIKKAVELIAATAPR